jgi:hypothetical protein
MENTIRQNLNDPEQLEKMYRSDKKLFEKSFYSIYDEIAHSGAATFWKARLDFDNRKETKTGAGKREVLLLLLICLVTGFLAEIPKWFNFGPNDFFFYEKNAGLIVLAGLSAYFFLTKEKLQLKPLLITITIFVVSAVFINLLPSDQNNQSVILACIHLPLMLWCLYGLVFVDFDLSDKLKRIDFIKYNGDLAILTALILIAGGLLTGVTLGLFSAIDLPIEQFYFDYIVVWGLVSAPIVATYIIKNYSLVTNKIAPIIANLFSPLVLITLVAYLISIIVTGKDPYNDRDFLIIFNLMLLGVTAIIVFSVSETSINWKQRLSEINLFVLSVVTLVIDLVALSAIVYRLGQFGFTPNRVAVLGSNLLIFGNLVLIMFDLYRVVFRQQEIRKVELTIARYLPIYAVWTVFVVFVLPFLFRMK